MTRKRRAIWTRRWLLTTAAALPIFQFFSGCFPNIPGLPNLPGAVMFELTNLFNNTVLDAFSVIVANVLNL